MVLTRKGGDRQGGSQTRGDETKWTYPSRILQANEQLREEIEITINNIDFRCIQLELTFQVGPDTHQQLLILNLSKAKLFRRLPYSAPPAKAERIERVFDYERKVLSEVGKLGKLWPVVEGREKIGAGRYSWKLCFLGRVFWAEAAAVELKMMVGVIYESERALAEKVLEEYVFLFQK